MCELTEESLLTRLSMLRSMASSRKAASVHTLWMEPTTVPLDAAMPKMNVQMESRSNWEGRDTLG